MGPIVRNEFFFFAVILGAAALLVLREWLALPRERLLQPASADAEASPPGLGAAQAAALDVRGRRGLS